LEVHLYAGYTSLGVPARSLFISGDDDDDDDDGDDNDKSF